MTTDRKQKALQTLALLEFDPLFYILDYGLCRAMLVKREDQYEYSGTWLQVQDGKWDVWPASMSKGQLQEYITNYTFTKIKDDMIDFLEAASRRNPLSTEEMQCRNSNQDFHY